MSAIHGQERSIDLSSLDALARPRRRWIVETLREEGALAVGELATGIAAWERDTSRGSIERTDRERTMVELMHVDLPVLADAGAIEYDPQERVARPSPTARTDGTVHDDVSSTVIDALADGRRRLALVVLGDRSEPISEATLARTIARAERDGREGPVTDEYTRAVQVTLHHCHLPKLDDAGLIEYDEDAREVERSDGNDDVVDAVVPDAPEATERDDHAGRGRGG